MKLRRNADAVIDLTKIDSTLIGSKMAKLCHRFSLNEGDYHVIYEPPGIARGMYFYTADGAIINFYIERTAGFHYKPRRIVRKRITGVSYEDGLCKTKKYYGTGMPWFGIIRHDCD